mmetsp:Transcript_87984/g.121349  ORF Transcript_87984/g.121349 Transcript_87984/m.121349 type:complete len:86 (+) Transcript_87984:664-921(+)
MVVDHEGGPKHQQQTTDANHGGEDIDPDQAIQVLTSLFQVFLHLLSFGDKEIVRFLMSNEYYLLTFGALEYDPEVFVFFNQNANA